MTQLQNETSPYPADRLTALGEDADFDVVIFGAGINGAGLFRDLCAQGLKCLIVDKGDFGSGTSAAPSRLIHGGLKYLETGEFGLVAQSTLERKPAVEECPPLCQPAADADPDLFLVQRHKCRLAHIVRLDQRAAQPWRCSRQDRLGALRFSTVRAIVSCRATGWSGEAARCGKCRF